MNIKEHVPSRCWYYLLDWNEVDNHKTMFEMFKVVKLSELDKTQFYKLFTIANYSDALEILKD